MWQSIMGTKRTRKFQNIAHFCAVEYFVFVNSTLTAYEYIYSQVFALFRCFFLLANVCNRLNLIGTVALQVPTMKHVML